MEDARLNKSLKNEGYSKLIEAFKSPVILIELDKSGEKFLIKRTNTAANKILCKRENKLIHHDIFEAFPELSTILSTKVLTEFLDKGSGFNTLLTLNRKDRKISLILDLLDFIDSKHILLLFRPIESLSPFYNNTSFLVKALNTTDDIIWVLDSNFQIISANETTQKYLGVPPSEIIGKHCFEITHKTKGPIALCPFLKMKKSQKRESMELALDKRWFQVTVDPIFNKGGALTGAIHIMRDITKQKKTELKLKDHRKKLNETNNLFRLMADTMSDMMWAKDKEKKFIFVNKALCEILLNAKDTQEPIGKGDLYFAERERKAHPENPNWHTFGEVCVDSDEITMNAGKPMQFFEYGNVKGKFLYLDVRKAPMYNEKGELIGVVGSARDITAEKLYEKTLKESEERYRTLFETTPVGYLILNTDGIILEANDKVAQRLGYNKNDLVGKDIREFLLAEDKEQVSKNIQTILKEGHLESEIRSIDKNGNISYVLLVEKKIKLPDGTTGILSVSIDITERKNIEQKLQEKEEQLWSLINSNDKDIVCFKDGEGRWLLANDADIKLFSLEGVDYYGKTDIELAEYTHPIYKDAFLTCANTDRITWESKTITRTKEIIPTPNGEIFVFDVIKVPLLNSDGSRKGLVVFGRDITEIEKANAELKRSEEHFRSIWENALDGMRVVDEEGIIIDVNKAFCDLVETDRESLIGKFYSTPFKDNRKNAKKIFVEHFKKRDLRTKYETEITLRNGKKKWFEVYNSFIKSPTGEALLLSVFRDITERKQLITDLVQAKEKAEEMDKIKTQFFLYMSHELRTPFMGIMGYAELLLESVKEENEKRMAQGILDSSHRMLETLSNILNVTKLEFDQLELKAKDLNIYAIIIEVIHNFKEAAKQKGLEIRRELNIPQDFTFKTDERIIYGILVNLVNNAIKFTEKGYIKISANIKKNGRKNFLILSVKDTGIGIPKSKQEIIWEEFRQVSEGSARAYQGSGLGLTIVKKYCNLIGAEISLKSRINSGSEFIVKIPIT